MSNKKVKLIIAGALTTIAMAITALGHDGFITFIGAMAAGYLFGKAEQL
jgi:hypothetical protein